MSARRTEFHPRNHRAGGLRGETASARIGPVPMRSFQVPKRRGFTILGLLCGLGAFGLLVVLFIPLYQNAKNAVTLRATMADMEMWTKAIQSYISDKGIAPANPNGWISFKKPIVRELLPYLERVQTTDWWGFSYWIWTGPGIDQYGIRTTGPADFIIASPGKEGIREAWKFDADNPQAGYHKIRELDDFKKDIVLHNGQFLRRPMNP
jgi:type II secretory pathway pseudopilin PulG